MRGLASNPKLLLLDEPAAGMNSTEKRELDATCKRIVERWNLSILLVEHDMDLVMGVSDYIYVLRIFTIITGRFTSSRAFLCLLSKARRLR